MRIEWIEKQMAEAEQLIYSNDIKTALALLDDLLYDEPGYGSLHNHLGWAYLYYTNEIEKAERHLKLAIRFDDAFAVPYLHLGTLYSRVTRYDEAITILRKGLTRPNANRIAFLESIAQAYELKKEFRGAIRMYKEALMVTVGGNGDHLTEAIKRCRRKRLVMMFTF